MFRCYKVEIQRAVSSVHETLELLVLKIILKVLSLFHEFTVQYQYQYQNIKPTGLLHWYCGVGLVNMLDIGKLVNINNFGINSDSKSWESAELIP